VLVRTLDVGGAGPVAALLAAKHAIEHEGRQAVAIVAGDTVASVPVAEFLARADGSCRTPVVDDIINRQQANAPQQQQHVSSPVIPNLYDRVASWHMQQYGTTREQLVSCTACPANCQWSCRATESRQRLSQPFILSNWQLSHFFWPRMQDEA
jgi:acetyl-CoA acetyltransferase